PGGNSLDAKRGHAMGHGRASCAPCSASVCLARGAPMQAAEIFAAKSRLFIRTPLPSATWPRPATTGAAKHIRASRRAAQGQTVVTFCRSPRWAPTPSARRRWQRPVRSRSLLHVANPHTLFQRGKRIALGNELLGHVPFESGLHDRLHDRG